jgi:exopolysaccharide biosynthesis polyprenyl glycosylphosphotransferase
MLRSFVRALAGLGFRFVMLADVVVLNVVMYATMVLRFGTDWPGETSEFVASFTLATFIFLATFYFGGFHERGSRLGAPPALPRALRLALVAGGLVALLTLSSDGLFRELGLGISGGLPFPFVNLLVLIVLGPMAIVANHAVAAAVFVSRFGLPRVLVCGSRADVDLASDHFDDESDGFVIAGTAYTVAAMRKAVTNGDVTDVVLASPGWLDRDFEEFTYELEQRRINVLVRVGGREVMYGLGNLRTFSGLPLVQLRASALPRSRSQFKRLVDLFLVIAFAPVWLPLFAAVAVYQLAVAGWPLFYVQNRVGLDDRVFPMLKFRTMRRGAESETGPVLSSDDDPRVIRASKWIRATRLDELPQLFNILRGEMSLVGPRPERPEMTVGFMENIPGYRRRNSIRPGLTGLAQIYGRYRTSAEYKLGYDLHYASNWSPILDLEILARTVMVVLTRRV